MAGICYNILWNAQRVPGGGVPARGAIGKEEYGLASDPYSSLILLIVFFVLISVVLALDPPTFIAQLMGISWGALAGAFLAPFLYGLFWKRTTKAAVWAAFICGVGITVANMYLNFFSSSIVAGAFSMLFGLVVVPVVSLLTPKPDEKKVDDIFFSMEE